MDRRVFIKGATSTLAGGVLLPHLGWTANPAPGLPSSPEDALPAGAMASSTLEALPGKRPLIKRTYRPPNYETPLELFRHPHTPNEAF